MSLRRFAILSAAMIGLGLPNLYSLPAQAQEGELVAQDTQAQINIRSLANTQADIVAAGVVGERAQILGYSNAEDGLLWYRIRLVKSGQVGWVRGDLVKVFGATKPKAGRNPLFPKVKTAQNNPVPLNPPKTSGSVKSIAPTQPSPTKTASKPQKAGEVSKTAQAKGTNSANGGGDLAAEPTVTPPTEANDPTTSNTIVSFQTATYAVRVFSHSGHLRLNLFNRKTNRIALRAVPVQSKNSGDGTTYSYITNDLQINIVVPETGQPTLTAIVLGDTLKEQPEVVASPEPVAKPEPATAAPPESAVPSPVPTPSP